MDEPVSDPICEIGIAIMLIIRNEQIWDQVKIQLRDSECKSKLCFKKPEDLAPQMIRDLIEKIKRFGPLKKANSNMGATYISKWIEAIYKAEIEKKLDA